MIGKLQKRKGVIGILLNQSNILELEWFNTHTRNMWKLKLSG